MINDMNLDYEYVMQYEIYWEQNRWIFYK